MKKIKITTEEANKILASLILMHDHITTTKIKSEYMELIHNITKQTHKKKKNESNNNKTEKHTG